MTIDPAVLQAVAGILVPLGISLLKGALPQVSGPNKFYINLAIQVLTALAAQFGLGGDPVTTSTMLGATSLGVPKLIDVAKGRVDPR